MRMAAPTVRGRSAPRDWYGPRAAGQRLPALAGLSLACRPELDAARATGYQNHAIGERPGGYLVAFGRARAAQYDERSSPLPICLRWQKARAPATIGRQNRVPGSPPANAFVPNYSNETLGAELPMSD